MSNKPDGRRAPNTRPPTRAPAPAHRRIHTWYPIWQGAEVREQSASGEAGAQLAQEVHHPCGNVLRRGKIWNEGEVVVYRAHGGRFKDGWEGWWMPEAASEVEERGDEWVRDARVVYPIVAFGIDSDEGLVWF